MRLIEIENHIKSMIEENGCDQDVYNEIHKLIYFYIKRNHKVNTDLEADEIAHLFAEDLFMRALNGNPVFSWLGYISKSLIGYIRAYKRMTQSELIDVTNDDELCDSIIRMSSSASAIANKAAFNEVDSLMWIDDFADVIWRNLERICKYNCYTREFYNIYSSILISLLNDGEIVYYSIEEKDINYCRMMYNKIKDRIVDMIKEMTEYVDNSSLMQSFFIGGDGGSESY